MANERIQNYQSGTFKNRVDYRSYMARKGQPVSHDLDVKAYLEAENYEKELGKEAIKLTNLLDRISNSVTVENARRTIKSKGGIYDRELSQEEADQVLKELYYRHKTDLTEEQWQHELEKLSKLSKNPLPQEEDQPEKESKPENQQANSSNEDYYDIVTEPITNEARQQENEWAQAYKDKYGIKDEPNSQFEAKTKTSPSETETSKKNDNTQENEPTDWRAKWNDPLKMGKVVEAGSAISSTEAREAWEDAQRLGKVIETGSAIPVEETKKETSKNESDAKNSSKDNSSKNNWAKKWTSGEMGRPFNELDQQWDAARRLGQPVDENSKPSRNGENNTKDSPEPQTKKRKGLEPWEKEMIRQGLLKIHYPIEEETGEPAEKQKSKTAEKPATKAEPELRMPTTWESWESKKNKAKPTPEAEGKKDEKPETEKPEDKKPKELSEIEKLRADLEAYKKALDAENEAADKALTAQKLAAEKEKAELLGHLEEEKIYRTEIERKKGPIKILKLMFRRHPKDKLNDPKVKAQRYLKRHYWTVAGATLGAAAASAGLIFGLQYLGAIPVWAKHVAVIANQVFNH